MTLIEIATARPESGHCSKPSGIDELKVPLSRAGCERWRYDLRKTLGLLAGHHP